jgi:polar amino acid transport system permease protein
MSQSLERYFAKHRIHFVLLNTIFIIILLKVFQMLVYPEANYTEALTAGNLHFVFFGMEDELGGLVLTFVLGFITIITSFIVGSIFGILRFIDYKPTNLIASGYVELFRSVPHIMVIFWVFFSVPIVGGAILETKIAISPFASAIIAFTLFESAHIAVIVRAGLESISKGQFEAAKTLGMTSTQAFILIILPQAYRRMIPSIVSQFVSLFKDTSLVYVIGVVEFFRAATIVNNRIYMSFEIISFVAIIYFLCAFTLSQIAGYLEKKVEKQINS